jgi:hypothetical protein
VRHTPRKAVTTSCSAAAPGEVTRPMPRGITGSGRLRRVEQAFALQLGLEAQELLEQSPLPGTLHALHDQLQIATLLVHAQTPAHFHQFAIARRKARSWPRGGTWHSGSGPPRP